MLHFFPITVPPPWVDALTSHGIDAGSIIPDPKRWHIFEAVNDRHYLLAIESGVFMETSPEAAAALRQYRSSLRADCLPEDIKTEISSLVSAGVFDTAETVDRGLPPVECINLNLCHDCNIRCSYCFACGGTYGEGVARMPLDVAFRSLDLLLAQLPDSAKANVVLFGGEPLLEKQALLRIVEYGRTVGRLQRNDLVFDIFTNGTLIDEEIGELVRTDPNVRLLMSLDGPPSINDLHRRGCGVEGVSAAVRRNLRHLEGVPSGKIVVRCTVAGSDARLVERARYFTELGLLNIVFDPAFCKGSKRIPDAETIYDAMTAELPEVAEYLAARVRSREKTSINVISEAIAQILASHTSGSSNYTPSCPAGRRYVSIDASGNVYPCHYFVGNREWILGHIGSDGLVQRDMVSDNGISDLSRHHSESCSSCWLRNLCEGPCPFKRLVLYPADRAVQDAYCRFSKARYVSALSLLSSFYSRARYPHAAEWQHRLSKDRVVA